MMHHEFIRLLAQHIAREAAANPDPDLNEPYRAAGDRLVDEALEYVDDCVAHVDESMKQEVADSGPVLVKTMDLIDMIANRELRPIPYSGRSMFGKHCVACVVSRGSDMQGLARFGAHVDDMGLDFVVYWPHAEWTDGVQHYVDTIFDESGNNN